MERCEDRRISLNRPKFGFGWPSMDFAGYIVSGEGYEIDPHITLAISEFPRPGNLTDMWSFFGLAYQLSEFTDQVAEVLEPLRPLLKPKNEYVWEQPQEEAFLKARSLLSSAPVLAYYGKTDQERWSRGLLQ